MILLFKFIMGGLAVLIATTISKRIGNRAGGFLSGFPAVFTAALILVALSTPEREIDITLKQMVMGTITSLVGALLVTWLAPKVFKRIHFYPALLLLFLFWLAIAASTGLILHAHTA